MPECMFNLLIDQSSIYNLPRETFLLEITNYVNFSCPFFRNEIGGEAERVVSLSREWGSGATNSSLSGPNKCNNNSARLHRSVAASTLGVLEPPQGCSHWRHALCPYLRNSLSIEEVDQGAHFFKTHFVGQGNETYFNTFT